MIKSEENAGWGLDESSVDSTRFYFTKSQVGGVDFKWFSILNNIT